MSEFMERLAARLRVVPVKDIARTAVVMIADELQAEFSAPDADGIGGAFTEDAVRWLRKEADAPSEPSHE